MYRIPYFLENEAKKFLKLKLSDILLDITDEFINNIFFNNVDNKYQNIIFSLEENIRKNIINIIIETFNIFDELYLNSDERKSMFNICVSKCHRSIVTIFGILEFDRTYYYDKSDRSKHFYFIDSLFHLPSYDRYDKIVKGLAIDNALSTNQKKGAEITTNQINSNLSYLNNNQYFNISRQDIYNWIDKWKVPNIEYTPIEFDGDTIYIMIDEKYIHEQLKAYINSSNSSTESKTNTEIKQEILEIINTLKNPPRQLLLPAPKKKTKHFIMSKAFVCFSDITTNKNRRTLNNKFTFLTTSNNPWDEFMNCVSKVYNFSKLKNIKVLSDAGSWIISGISNLKLYVDNVIIPCLCEFHAKQKINRSTKDEEMRKKLWNSINNDNKLEFKLLYGEIMKNKDEKRKKMLKSYKHYIMTHWNSIKEMKKSKFKSSMESHISHCIAKLFAYEPKAYSKKHIQKLIKLQEYKLNGINIFNLYLKSCENKEVITLKKEQLSFSIFDNYSSNLPALNSINNDFSRTLKNICSIERCQ